MPEKHMHEFSNKDLRLNHFAFIKMICIPDFRCPCHSDFILREQVTSQHLQNYACKFDWSQYFATTEITVLKEFYILSRLSFTWKVKQ